MCASVGQPTSKRVSPNTQEAHAAGKGDLVRLLELQSSDQGLRAAIRVLANAVRVDYSPPKVGDGFTYAYTPVTFANATPTEEEAQRAFIFRGETVQIQAEPCYNRCDNT